MNQLACIAGTICALVLMLVPDASAGLAVKRVEVAPPTAQSRVPSATAQGRGLSPQAVSAVDVSPDGQFITVGTMAFSHEPNVWLLSADGTVREKRNLPPWAPLQVATLAGGHVTAAGMAYSRVTSPEPMVWCGTQAALFRERLRDDLCQADARDGNSRWRHGEGDWRTGWFASCLGELFMRGPDWIFQPPATMVDAAGQRQRLSAEDKNLLPANRASRMAASADGKQAAFGGLCLREPAQGFAHEKNLLSVWELSPNRSRWTAPPSVDLSVPVLADPTADFPELLAAGFRLGADQIAQGTIATALALNRDGSRVAVVEHGVWMWVRNGSAIGGWDPPIHALNFVPKQHGRLRVFDGDGNELLREMLPEKGLFEIGFGDQPDAVWCWPSSWFARGMAGEAWLPVDPSARTAYRVGINLGVAEAFVLPDAVADCAVNPAAGRMLISCWDGRLYLLGAKGEVCATLESGAPARLAWSSDGSFAIAGTANGRVLRIDRDGKAAWNHGLAVADPPASTAPPVEVITGVPIYNVGRTGLENAYVGDMWLIKAGTRGILVDAGGTSSLPRTLARVKTAGVDQVTHVIQTHSHGDHAGGAYLWRAFGAKIVGPQSAALTTTWLMPMLTDYGLFPPRPLDVPLSLVRAGDETEFELSGVKFRALFVPGHSFDSTVYMTELGGNRIAFTGDLGFQAPADILHRCWGDVEKARAVVNVVKHKLLPWQPTYLFTGHSVHPDGTAFLRDLVQRTEVSLAKAAAEKEKK